MKGTSVAALGLLIMSVVPMSLFAKWHTDKITIEGVGLTTPVEITSPEIGQFEVFAGPGTWGNGVEGREGFIINWSKGIVAERPTGLQHYKVSFHSKLPGERPAYQVIYVVSYDYDPSMNQGYIYLPGKTDEWIKFQRMWHGHGFEGNWACANECVGELREAANRESEGSRPKPLGCWARLSSGGEAVPRRADQRKYTATSRAGKFQLTPYPHFVNC